MRVACTSFFSPSTLLAKKVPLSVKGPVPDSFSVLLESERDTHPQERVSGRDFRCGTEMQSW